MNLTDLTPPQDREAERAVLSAMLIDPACIDDVCDITKASDFYFDGHMKVFQAAVDLHANGKPCDWVAVREELRRRGQHEDAGGDLFLAELFQIMPTAANSIYHAGIVRETATRRRLTYLAREILGEAMAGRAQADELIADAESKLFALSRAEQRSETTHVEPVVKAELGRLDKLGTAEAEGPGVATGFRKLDEMMGGWREGLYMIGARPSVGKSAFMLSAALAAVRAGVPTLMFSLEMSRQQLVQRHLSMLSGVNLKRLRGSERLSDGEASDIIPAAAGLSKAPLFINDSPGLTPARLLSITRRLARKEGVRLIFVDYLQLLEPDGGRRAGANRYEQVTAMTRSLKLLSKAVGIPVVALAQLNRAVEGREQERPKLSDFRESGSIEQDADDCYLLWRIEAPENLDLQTVGLFVGKQRNGPTGEIRLGYRKSCTRFEDYREGYHP